MVATVRRPREPCTAFYEWEVAIMNETAYIQETSQPDNSRPAPSVAVHVAVSRSHFPIHARNVVVFTVKVAPRTRMHHYTFPRLHKKQFDHENERRIPQRLRYNTCLHTPSNIRLYIRDEFYPALLRQISTGPKKCVLSKRYVGRNDLIVTLQEKIINESNVD